MKVVALLVWAAEFITATSNAQGIIYETWLIESIELNDASILEVDNKGAV